MPERRFATLGEWLAWQETLHHSEIDLGLERVADVARRLFDIPPRYPVITVAGTNGKGSVLAYLQAILGAAAYQTGLFTSPHLLRYNERVTVGGTPVQDKELISAFEAIDAARGSISLTYFEFSTLAALLIFQRRQVDIGLLEVGMGGRLDAVNIIAPDVAVITSIGLDHQAWLGDNREAIGREKAGIMRQGRPAVCGDPDPPQSLLAHAEAVGAALLCVNRDYSYALRDGTWDFAGPGAQLTGLPVPALRGQVQLGNAALALAALQCLGDRMPIAAGHVRRGLQNPALNGRIQILGDAPRWVLDVCHNADSASVLADWLAANPCPGRTRLVLGMLRDKDVEEVAALLLPQVDDWYLAGLAGPRGLPADELEGRIRKLGVSIAGAGVSVESACRQAKEEATDKDRIVVCGSFQTVGAALALAL